MGVHLHGSALVQCTCIHVHVHRSFTQPKIIGLDSIPTAVRYRIEDKEELESST